jgi:hypothetical protein
MKFLTLAVYVVAGGLLVGPVAAQQSTANASHQHDTAQPGTSTGHDKMMSDAHASDAALEALMQRVTSARGDDKIKAMQELLAELVRAQTAMHQNMATMHEHMMGHGSQK